MVFSTGGELKINDRRKSEKPEYPNFWQNLLIALWDILYLMAISVAVDDLNAYGSFFNISNTSNSLVVKWYCFGSILSIIVFILLAPCTYIIAY